MFLYLCVSPFLYFSFWILLFLDSTLESLWILSHGNPRVSAKLWVSPSFPTSPRHLPSSLGLPPIPAKGTVLIQLKHQLPLVLRSTAPDMNMEWFGAQSLGQGDPWRREWQPAPVLLPREFPGQRTLAGCSPWGCKESDGTDRGTPSLAT